MSYKTITTLLHDPATYEETLRFAIATARRWNAHLHIVCAGVNFTEPGFYYAGAQATIMADNRDEAKAAATELLNGVKGIMASEDILWDTEGVILMNGAVDAFLIGHMRYYDLVVLPSPYAETSGRIDVAIYESCLFGARLPVLVAPPKAKLGAAPLRFMVAWDDGQEALAAAKAAAPLFEKGSLAEVCIINPPPDGPDRSDPGGRVAQMLARAGGNVEISVMAKLQYDIAEQLLQHAAETQADLIVMGAYGHSRFREAVIGGVTRTMLRKSTLPVLMAR